MTSIEPVRRAQTEILPSYNQASWVERKAYAREAREVFFREQLEYTVRRLRLSNYYKLNQELIDMQVELAEDIVRKLERTDNPLIRVALERRFDRWITESDEIISYRW